MKLHRTSTPPAGFGLELRNTRLYGSLEEQVSGRALASRGQPSPDRAVVTRKRADLRAEREERARVERLQRAQDKMLQAQRRVRAAKSQGLPFADLAAVARAARADYLRLTGGVESRTLEVAALSDSGLTRVS